MPIHCYGCSTQFDSSSRVSRCHCSNAQNIVAVSGAIYIHIREWGPVFVGLHVHHLVVWTDSMYVYCFHLGLHVHVYSQCLALVNLNQTICGLSINLATCYKYLIKSCCIAVWFL